MPQMEFDVISGYAYYPVSLRFVVLLSLLYLFLGIPVASRNRFPLLSLSLPIFWSFLGTFLLLFGIVRVMTTTAGVGLPTAAAGAATAQIPLIFAFLIVGVLNLIYALRRRRPVQPSPMGSTRNRLFISALVACLLAGEILITARLVERQAEIGLFGNAAWIFAVIAAVALGAIVVVVVAGRGKGPVAVRTAAFAVAAVSVAVACFLYALAAHLSAIAVIWN